MSEKKAGSFPPVVAWAIFGLICTVFSFSIFGQWIFSSEFSPVPITSQDAMADGGVLKIRILEVISTAIAVFAFYTYLIKPWAKTRKAPILGLVIIGALVSYVIDATVNYHGYFMAWNAHSINWGTWNAFFPFHTGPRHYAEALFWGPPMYIYFGVLFGLIQYSVIKFMQRRFKASLVVAVLSSMVVAFVLDLAAEWGIIYLTQAYAWANTVRAFTLFPGSQFQFPLYECLAVSIYGAIYASLIKSSRENKEAYVERGVSTLKRAWQLPARIFAAVGFAFVPTIVYFGLFTLISTFANSAANLPHYLMYFQ